MGDVFFDPYRNLCAGFALFGLATMLWQGAVATQPSTRWYIAAQILTVVGILGANLPYPVPPIVAAACIVMAAGFGRLHKTTKPRGAYQISDRVDIKRHERIEDEQ